MKNADFQYVGLSFSKEAFSDPCSSSMWKFQEKAAVCTKNSSHKWHLAELVSSSSCTSNRSPFASRSRRHMSLTFQLSIFFRLQLRELPKTPVGFVRIFPYNHGFLVENGSENMFWGNTIFEGCSVPHWTSTIRKPSDLSPSTFLGGSLGLTLQGINEVVDL